MFFLCRVFLHAVASMRKQRISDHHAMYAAGQKNATAGIRNHEDRAHGHGRAGQHGAHGRPAEKVQKAGRHRDAYGVEGEGPEQVLTDVAHDRTA